MAIKVGREYRISTDKFNVTIEKKKIKKETGDEYWVAEGFFSSYKDALVALVNRDIMDADLNSLKQIVKRLEQIEGWIRRLPLAEEDRPDDGSVEERYS